MTDRTIKLQMSWPPSLNLKLRLSVFAGVLLFGVGLLLGQQIQRSKFDKYLRPATPTPMDVAILKANVQVMKNFMSLEVPTVYYDSSRAAFTAHATITSDLMKQPLEQVRARLTGMARTTRDALGGVFPEISKLGTAPDPDFSMTFFELNLQNPDASHDLAEYVDGKIVFK